MSLRRAIFWVHLAVGAAAGLVILMMAATGTLLTYEAQLNRWALRGYRSGPPAMGAEPLVVDELIARAAAEGGAGSVRSVALRRDPREPAILRTADGSTAYLDRFTGELRGDGNTATRRYLRSVLYWHRWFALEGNYRIVGRTFTATANLCFFGLLASGIYLWWPLAARRVAWRRVLWFRRGLRGRARNFNWHTVIGFWSAVPLLVIVASGATISYRWAADLVHWLARDEPAAYAPQEVGSPAASLGLAQLTGPPLPLDALVGRAVSGMPAWRAVTVRLPEGTGHPVVVAVDRGTGRQPSRSEDLLLDQGSGEVIQRGGYPSLSRGHKVRRWLRFAHTGEVYGVIGQSVAGIVSGGVTVLVWSGLAMSWRRFFGRPGRPPSP